MKNSSYKTPIIIDDNGIKKLEKVPLTSKEFEEIWMQELLAENPSLLPTVEVDDIYSRLTFIDREVSCASGFIDNLYISEKGYLVIVETKLWRNPEARRQVVSQIIDYAKDLQNWTYEMLDEVFQKKHDIKLYDYLVDNCDLKKDEESIFIDKVINNIKKARFLLLIVGDGIREETKQMVDFLNNNPSMQFQLALCELEIYKKGKDRIVIPHLTMKTHIVERGIITIHNNEVDIEMSDSNSDSGERKNYRDYVTYEQWLKQTPFTNVTEEEVNNLVNDLTDVGTKVSTKTKELHIDLDNQNFNSTLNLFMFFQDGETVGFQPKKYYSFVNKYGYSTKIVDSFLQSLIRYLSSENKHKPYDPVEGYYYITYRKFIDCKDEIISLVEDFTSNF